MAVLPDAEFEARAYKPTAVLSPAVVTLLKLEYPIAVLAPPVEIFLSELTPIPVFFLK